MTPTPFSPSWFCPSCGYGPVPGDADAARAASVANGMRPCPTCGAELDPDAAPDGRRYDVTTVAPGTVAVSVGGALVAVVNVSPPEPIPGMPARMVHTDAVWCHPDYDDGSPAAAAFAHDPDDVTR